MKQSEQQKYLLSRIPSVWDLKKRRSEESPEPKEVRAAKRVVERWKQAQEKAVAEEKARLNRLILDAKDAVYFSTPEKALALIKALEKMKRE